MKAGITGHQHIRDVKWVRDKLSAAVLDLAIEGGWTALADGADQLFARVMLEHNRNYSVVVPCFGYESTFSAESVGSYWDLIFRAQSVITLPFDSPTEQAFYEAGVQVVNRSNLVVAVWEGLTAAGLGGTADIVEYAVKKNMQVLHINPYTREVHYI